MCGCDEIALYLFDVLMLEFMRPVVSLVLVLPVVGGIAPSPTRLPALLALMESISRMFFIELICGKLRYWSLDGESFGCDAEFLSILGWLPYK